MWSLVPLAALSRWVRVLPARTTNQGWEGRVRGSLPKETHFLGNVSGWVEHEWTPLKQS